VRGRRLFDKATEVGDSTLLAGFGETDKFGNVLYSTLGTADDIKLARYHESVHSFLSPKIKLFRELRADIGMTAYDKSSFLRYLEEALAESYAQLRVNGLRGLPTGIKFPIKESYVTIQAVAAEGALMKKRGRGLFSWRSRRSPSIRKTNPVPFSSPYLVILPLPGRIMWMGRSRKLGGLPMTPTTPVCFA
jgi:hypothetical protein